MREKRIAIFLRLMMILFLFGSMNLVGAQAKSKAKSGEGLKKGWTKEKREGQKSETPPGWEKGLKKGWEKLTPPGWNKKNKKEKKEWQKKLARVKKQIKTKAKKKKWNAENCERASIALEFAVRRGMPASQAGNVIGECIGKGLTGEEILLVGIVLSEGVDKGTNFETMGSRVVEKIRAGYKGKKLAREIRFMIDTDYKTRKEVKEKKLEKLLHKEEFKHDKKEEKLERPVSKDSGGGGRGRGGK